MKLTSTLAGAPRAPLPLLRLLVMAVMAMEDMLHHTMSRLTTPDRALRTPAQRKTGKSDFISACFDSTGKLQAYHDVTTGQPPRRAGKGAPVERVKKSEIQAAPGGWFETRPRFDEASRSLELLQICDRPSTVSLGRAGVDHKKQATAEEAGKSEEVQAVQVRAWMRNPRKEMENTIRHMDEENSLDTNHEEKQASTAASPKQEPRVLHS